MMNRSGENGMTTLARSWREWCPSSWSAASPGCADAKASLVEEGPSWRP